MPTTGSSSPETSRPDPDRLLTVREVASRLRVDEKTVARWVRKGAMQAVEVGPFHRVRISPAEVARHLRPYEALE